MLKKLTKVEQNQNLKTESLLTQLSANLPDMTPEVRKAAIYLIDNANEIGLTSIREMAVAAQVKPNSLIRMANAIGLDGYESFRKPFRELLKKANENFPDRARWLQALGKGGNFANLYADMAAASISNVETMYRSNQSYLIKLAADHIVKSRWTYILGVGLSNSLAQNFAYTAGMAIDKISAIPNNNSMPIDAIAKSDHRDVLIVMSFKPYLKEIVDVVELAKKTGMTIIAISDTLASPIASPADYRFVVQVDSPQFFTSTVALSAFLETLLAFVIADASATVITNIERFHKRRHELGIYYSQ